MNSFGYRPDIDGLRALAILGVLIYHFNASLLPGGFVGVDVFFVISGYLISRIIFRETDNYTFSFLNFYTRRIRRIFPALIVILVTTLFFGWFALLANEYKLLGNHTTAAAIFLANFRLMKESGYFDVASHLKPLLHLWSLAIEEQFYIIWPLLLVWLAKTRINRTFGIFIVTFVSIIVSAWLSQKGSATTHFFHPLSRFWELSAGGLLASIPISNICLVSDGMKSQEEFSTERIQGASKNQSLLRKKESRRLFLPYSRSLPSNDLIEGWNNELRVFLGSLQFQLTRNNLSGLLGLAFILYSYFAISGENHYPSLLATFPVVGAMLLIYAGNDSVSGRLLSNHALVGIGLISYPLYLWHWPIFSFIRISESGYPEQWILFVGIILAFILAWLTYILVEKNIRHLGSKFVPWILLVSMVLIAIFGRWISLQQGFPHRKSLAYLNSVIQQTTREIAHDTECLSYTNSNTPPYYCRMIAGSGAVLAVIGDSHAQVLFPGIAKLRHAQGAPTILLANSGCPPLLGSTFGDSFDERSKCSKSIEEIIRLVEANPQINKVLIVTRGPIYITGKGFGPAEEKYNHPPISSAVGEKLPPSEIFQSGLEATAKRLRVAGKQVEYMLQVPEIGVSPLDCSGRPLRLNPFPTASATERCQQTLTSYEERMLDYRTLVGKASTNAAFSVYDPKSVFCSKGLCSAFKDGNLLYADDNHLSVMGSQLVAQQMGTFILP